MKLGFDVSPLGNENKVRGMGVYTRELLSQLKTANELEVQEFSDVAELNVVDMVHYPYFDLFKHTLSDHQPFPFVVTVPDIIPLLFPKHYPAGIKGSINLWRQKRSLKKARAIITLSESSKKDIVQYFHFPAEKVFVTHLAPNPSLKKVTDKKKLHDVRNRYALPDKFAIYVGSVNWNKNIIGLTQASLDAGLDIYLIGKAFEQRDHLEHPELRSFAQFLKEFENNPKVHMMGFVEDGDLLSVMNLATVMLFPSFYEGFGLPVLEAQACELPVITSSLSSLPEIGGEGAVYVVPYSIGEITQAIKKVLNDTLFRDTLVKEGLINVKQFTWHQTASQTIQVYEDIIKRR